MKKSLFLFAAIITIASTLTSCEHNSISAEKTAAANFLTVPAEQTYSSGCGVELCFCEEAKQHFSFDGGR